MYFTSVYKGARFIDLSQLAGLKQPQWETRLNRQVWPVKFGQRAVGLSLQLSAAVEKETKDQANQEIKVKKKFHQNNVVTNEISVLCNVLAEFQLCEFLR